MRRALLAALGLAVMAGCDMVPKSSHASSRGRVLKVYAVEDGGYRFTAYAVEYRGSEVIVIDYVGTSAKKVGDEVEYMVTRSEFRGHNGLSFTLL